MVNQFSNLQLTYFTYFEISASDPNFRPDPLIKYLSRPNEEQAAKNTFLRLRLERLMNLTDYAIAQQSLLAGNLLIEPAYSILFTSSGTSEDKRMAVDVLSKNKLFALNFASYLLYKNLGLSESSAKYTDFVKQYEKVKAAPETVGTLDQFASVNDIRFKYNSTDKKFYLSFKQGGQDVDLLMPEITTVRENQMKNTEALFALLQTRRMLANKLIDLSFTQNLPGAQGASEKTLDFFKYSFIQ